MRLNASVLPLIALIGGMSVGVISSYAQEVKGRVDGTLMASQVTKFVLGTSQKIFLQNLGFTGSFSQEEVASFLAIIDIELQKDRDLLRRITVSKNLPKNKMSQFQELLDSLIGDIDNYGKIKNISQKIEVLEILFSEHSMTFFALSLVENKEGKTVFFQGENTQKVFSQISQKEEDTFEQSLIDALEAGDITQEQAYTAGRTLKSVFVFSDELPKLAQVKQPKKGLPKMTTARKEKLSPSKKSASYQLFGLKYRPMEFPNPFQQ